MAKGKENKPNGEFEIHYKKPDQGKIARLIDYAFMGTIGLDLYFIWNSREFFPMLSSEPMHITTLALLGMNLFAVRYLKASQRK